MKIRMNNAVGPQVRSEKPKPSKLLPALGGVALVSGLQTATQFFAYTFNYQATLGGHLGHVYAPWSILQWASKWNSHYPDEIMKAGSMGMLVSTVGLLGVAVAKVVTANTSKANEYLHGSARWSEKKDIQAAGLLPRDRNWLEIVTAKAAPTANGVYVGGWMDKGGEFYYLRLNGPGHVLTYAPTGSGKGVGLVVPTLLSWGASAVITDLKGELWALTAGWRKKHAKNKVLRFEPASSSGGVCWNPLDEIRLGTESEVGDVQNIATLIVDPDGKGMESHWQKTAFALLVGVILHALYKAKNEGGTATLPSVDSMLADPNRDIGELWMEMVTYGHVDGQTHHVIGSAARDMLDRPEEEAGSVLSTAKSYLALYRDPVVARNVSRSDFRIKQLMHDDDPVSLYIVTQPNDKARLRPLVRLTVNMIVRLLATKLDFVNGRPVAHYKHELLMMMDEFPSLGKLEIMQESLAFLRGYGIKCYLICQDINQLKSRETGYGPDESITSNCHVQNAYPPNRVETAEHLSRLTGQTTIVKEQITTSGRRSAAMLGQVSRTYQEVQRPLLTPDECMRMPGPKKNDKGDIVEGGDMVIYVAGYPAIYGKQPLYFKDPVFQARAAIPAPEVSDRLLAQAAPEGEGITI
jgi:type IV secretion system protein VirD4